MPNEKEPTNMRILPCHSSGYPITDEFGIHEFPTSPAKVIEVQSDLPLFEKKELVIGYTSNYRFDIVRSIMFWESNKLNYDLVILHDVSSMPEYIHRGLERFFEGYASILCISTNVKSV